MRYEVHCDLCGRVSTGTVSLPTSGGVGDTRPLTGSCDCGSEAVGVATVVELTQLGFWNCQRSLALLKCADRIPHNIADTHTKRRKLRS